MTPEQVYDLRVAARIVANGLRERQSMFLGAAVSADQNLASLLRKFASQDGEMAELLELALKEDA